ncbi:hypothetical protein Y886_03775 [Xanthomonas hyacinthi DSM 19077]|nr:hypothetical protein Y886_03775 [Xanthomonas hyacinthi DSM 19077]
MQVYRALVSQGTGLSRSVRGRECELELIALDRMLIGKGLTFGQEGLAVAGQIGVCLVAGDREGKFPPSGGQGNDLLGRIRQGQRRPLMAKPRP